jgi:hypothetical protein
MKHVALTLSMLVLGAAQAKADGFVCQAADGSLNLRAFNQTAPAAGTRNSAVLIVSDPGVSFGRKTIARFTAGHTLVSQGSSYIANVDLRFNDSNRKGELIGGTKLGELKQIKLDVDFSYAAPVGVGQDVDAQITLTKRNGGKIGLPATCTRYLKGE